ncbi:hypothetical protein [Slackia sp.]|uniref:hypothetical protein n=1 Tax=Slackia sp. TaxID=2049041 RepID=UPI002E787415|nr:hypothetical protein [Slackia sp.]MEE0518440.1 hypothetical protein [Slackia sp.]
MTNDIHSEQPILRATEKREQPVHLTWRPTEQDLTPCPEIAPDACNCIAHIALNVFGTAHRRKPVKVLCPHAADMEPIIESVTIHNAIEIENPSRKD